MKKGQKICGPKSLIFSNDAAAIATHYPHFKGSVRNIKSLTPVKMPNTLQRMNSGAFFNNVRTIDLYGKSFTDTEFKISEKYNEFAKVGEAYNLSDHFLKTICEEESYNFQYIKDKHRRNQTFEKVIGYRVGYMNLFETYGLLITVVGDTEIVAGDVIYIILDEANVSQQDLPPESFYSRSWFVIEVKHVIDRGEIVSMLTIVKDSLKNVIK